MNIFLNIKHFGTAGKLFFLIALCFLLPTANLFANPEQNIIIGLDADMSGPAKLGGTAIQRGAQIAIDEINEKGGVLGRKLALLVKDHRGNPARGVFNINQFAKTDGVVAVIGGVHTPIALAELPDIHKHKLIYLGAWAAGTSIVDNGFDPNFVFRVSLRDSEAGEVMIESAKRKGYSKVALVLERTPWGRSNLDSISKAAHDHNISITKVSWINWNQVNFKNEMKAILKLNPDAILLVANAPEGATLAKHLLSNDKTIPVISHWGVAGGKFVEMVGKNNLAKLDFSVLQSFHFEASKQNEVAQNLLKTYRQEYEKSATQRSVQAAVGVAQAYDLVHLLALALEQANSLDRERIREQMLLIKEYKGAVKYYSNPFKKRQDALVLSDYVMTGYDESAQLYPLQY